LANPVLLLFFRYFTQCERVVGWTKHSCILKSQLMFWNSFSCSNPEMELCGFSSFSLFFFRLLAIYWYNELSFDCGWWFYNWKDFLIFLTIKYKGGVVLRAQNWKMHRKSLQRVSDAGQWAPTKWYFRCSHRLLGAKLWFTAPKKKKPHSRKTY